MIQKVNLKWFGKTVLTRNGRSNKEKVGGAFGKVRSAETLRSNCNLEVKLEKDSNSEFEKIWKKGFS